MPKQKESAKSTACNAGIRSKTKAKTPEVVALISMGQSEYAVQKKTWLSAPTIKKIIQEEEAAIQNLIKNPLVSEITDFRKSLVFRAEKAYRELEVQRHQVLRMQEITKKDHSDSIAKIINLQMNILARYPEFEKLSGFEWQTWTDLEEQLNNYALVIWKK